MRQFSDAAVFFLCLFFSYFFLFVFSYLWVDFNLSLTRWPFWASFLDKFQHWGYFHRSLAAKIYLGLLALLFIGQLYLLFSRFLERQSLRKLLILAAGTTLAASLAYPFLSYDIFSYLFDAKIVWRYHRNPYLYAPQDFAGDSWLRFMRWTHRTYPYGPIWLVATLLPALFSGGKFFFNFYFLKIFQAFIFFSSGWLIFKITQDKKVFAFWFFNPFLVLELLVNAHNDLLMIALFFLAYFLVFRAQKKVLGGLTFLLGSASKYISFLFGPVFLIKKEKPRKVFFSLALLVLLVAFFLKAEKFQPWYFSWLWMGLPFLGLDLFSWLAIFLAEALILFFKYYPFLFFGNWEKTGYFTLMRAIFLFLGLLISGKIIKWHFFSIRKKGR